MSGNTGMFGAWVGRIMTKVLEEASCSKHNVIHLPALNTTIPQLVLDKTSNKKQTRTIIILLSMYFKTIHFCLTILASNIYLKRIRKRLLP